MATVYLGLGANLGDRRQNLTQSLDLLSRQAEIEQVSSVYETEPVGFKEQPLFLNAVCRIATKLSPRQLLSLVKKIEVTLGRIPSFPDAPRPIDIDILFYGNKIIKSQNLTIPHPRLVQRAFVLIPLAEIAPEVIHPENGKTVKELLRGCLLTQTVIARNKVTKQSQKRLPRFARNDGQELLNNLLFSNLENTEGIRKWAEAAEIMNLNRRHNVPGIS